MLKNDKNCRYKFNLSLVIKLLYDYLNSENEFEQIKRYGNSPDDTVYGISCYDKIIKYLNNNIVFVNDLTIEYSEVCNLAKRCHLLAIKYRLSPKSSIIDRLKNYIIEIKEKDRKITSSTAKNEA